MSEQHLGPEGERRLREAGFVPEPSPTGKQRWKDPETGRMKPGGSALDEVERREERELEEAGWSREEVEGETAVEDAWRESERREEARRRAENRFAWCEYHRDQAARHRTVLAALVEHHEQEAEKYLPKGDAA